MGKKHKRTRTIEAPVAERHGFDSGGLLGHDSTYSVNVTEHVALSVDTVFACVRTLADLTADAVIGEYRGTERLDDSRLVQRPMASVTRRTWIWQLTAIMALYNGSYLYERFGTDAEGVPVSVEPVSPTRVNWTSADTVTIDGVAADPRRLRWVPRMTMPTLTRDLSYLLRLARQSFSAAWSADAYRADFWETGAPPSYYLSADQVMDNTTAEKIADRIVERRTASPGRPLVLGSGAELKSLQADMSAEGASAAASRLGTSVARYFGVPPWLVNVPSEAGSLTYANAGAAGLDLVRYTLQPGYAGPIGDAWSDLLPGSYLTGRRVVLDLTHLTRGTILEQAQAYQIATGQKPWMLPSEVRADLHMPMDMALDEAGAPAPAMESIPQPAAGA